MLNSSRHDPRSNELIIRSLTDDPYANSLALGCPSCPHFAHCGGLSVKDPIIDCLDLCCGSPQSCTRVCRNNALLFTRQVREIAGFDLADVPLSPVCPANIDVDIIPLIYHGSRRAEPLEGKCFALRLSDLIDFTHARLRYASREDLYAAFHIAPTATLILSGVNHDDRVEPWWTLGERRLDLIKGLGEIGIELATTPNFSLLLDNPRTDDLHAMKRIAISFEEFQRHGLSCALHPNGRTLRDFERWGEFIAARPEVQILAYEFITGSSQKHRMSFHVEGLSALAAAAGRPLDIVLRGDPQAIPLLRPHFHRVFYIDTTAFMKTIKRCRAERVDNNKLEWPPYPTNVGENLDRLMRRNVTEQIAFLRASYFGSDPSFLQKAA